ncbi:anthranilate synthase component I [Anaerosacchariphilus polymeriproducens]|uniref:Anthranilate synthase component 1 n=1 Tax=Anaerosacchariphilus polymeriproducens TaxID=1812858 RepID=A0A371AV71_9FIRM|nr:anthranilate synthase component I [Anaerosacchariphilus polymeriproducens]RDU23466.1 anthranilate synthase component I [Anaerosacchariphilus polymeriproducens]
MNFYPSLEKVKAIAKEKQYKVVPVSCEMFADTKTPIEVLKILKKVSQNTYMLESVEDNKNRGRYTFLGYNPSLELTCLNGVLNMKRDKSTTIETDNPGQYIREIIQEHKSPKMEELPPFTGGLVGYFAYDYIKYAEPSLNLDAKDEENFKDVDLMLFDKVIAFDHLKQKIILIVNVKLEQIDTEYSKAIDALKEMITLIQHGEKQEDQIPELKSELRHLFRKEEYCRMVEKAKKHIYEGDIFQVVLSNRFDADFEGSLLDVYRVLRTTNPSPYMFYFSSNELEIAGASPETLVKLKDGIVHSFPLAGTRPRGSNEKQDQELKNELLADEKELAEHNMLVDLGRNDLGKISEFNTVGVDKYMSVEFFSHVMHIGSTVSGKIRKDKDAADAVEAVLPAGTLSGAPKIKACEIINKLENNKRGIYGGAIGYIDFTGNLDTCIAIRLAFKKNGKVFIRSGAGIVADSVPEREYEECLNKAKAVLNAIEIAREGIV